MSKVAPGDQLAIRAADWNVLLEVADAWRQNQVLRTAGSSGITKTAGVVVPVKNGTGSTVDRFHAMGLGDPLFTYADNAQTFKNQLAFDGETMSSSYLGKFCVAQETIANGKIGLCMVQGVTPAEITVSHADNNRVDVDTAGGSKLVSAFYGAAEILHKPAGTGTKWVLLRIGSWEAPPVKATASGDIAANGSGTVAIQINGSGSQSVTAYLNWLEGTTGVTSGDELLIQFFRDENKWVITGAEC